MAAPRFLVSLELTPASIGQTIALPAAAAHHAVRVVRLAVGDALTLFNGAGGEYAATLARTERSDAWVRVEAFDPVERESPLPVTLAQSIAANDAMDYAVRKATELGVAAIQPLGQPTHLGGSQAQHLAFDTGRLRCRLPRRLAQTRERQ